VRASLRLPEDNERKIGALQQALIDGENSGGAGELHMNEIKSKARRRTGSKS
jgi:antitoxin ParD1/3/4